MKRSSDILAALVWNMLLKHGTRVDNCISQEDDIILDLELGTGSLVFLAASS